MPADTAAEPHRFSARIREASWSRHQGLDPSADAQRAPGVFDRLFDGTLSVDDYTRWRLLNGLDDIGLTLQNAAQIAAYERRRSPWLPVTTATS